MYFVVKLLCDASEPHLVWIVIDFDIDDYDDDDDDGGGDGDDDAMTL